MNTQKELLGMFRAAKTLALSLPNNVMRRARHNGMATDFFGANVNGRFYVLYKEIKKPDATISGIPAREVFGEFSIMYKR